MIVNESDDICCFQTSKVPQKNMCFIVSLVFPGKKK